MAWRSEQSALPPQEYWLIKYGEKLPTPTDDRGIIDTDATIALVKEQIDPSYRWTHILNTHHFYWDDDSYPHISAKGQPNPKVFKELGPHKGLMPQDFHAFLHAITLQPAVPSKEVMHYRIEAWKVAESLFRVGKKVIRKEREYRRYLLKAANDPGLRGDSESAQAERQDRFDRWFAGIDRHREQNEKLPREFRFFDSDAPLNQIAGNLGRIIIPKSLELYKAVAA